MEKEFVFYVYWVLEIVFFNIYMLCPQHFHNIFKTNPKWQVVIGCYCWGKKVILVLGSNLN